MTFENAELSFFVLPFKAMIFTSVEVFFVLCLLCTAILEHTFNKNFLKYISIQARVSVQGVKSLGGHFACLCRGFEFCEVK